MSFLFAAQPSESRKSKDETAFSWVTRKPSIKKFQRFFPNDFSD